MRSLSMPSPIAPARSRASRLLAASGLLIALATGLSVPTPSHAAADIGISVGIGGGWGHGGYGAWGGYGGYRHHPGWGYGPPVIWWPAPVVVGVEACLPEGCEAPAPAPAPAVRTRKAPVYSPATPPAPAAPDPVIYPAQGQSARQTEADRQACNTLTTRDQAALLDAQVFQQQVTACMVARGYTVR